MLISTTALPEYYADIVKNELNVKEVELGADLSEYVNYEILPNLPVLGKLYGKLIPQIKKALGEQNQAELAKTIKNNQTKQIEIDGTVIEFTADNLLVNMKGIEGFAFAGEGEIGIVLDTHMTDELIEEGYVREIISKIQNLRKDTGFEVLDMIDLYIAGNEKLEKVIEKNKEQIMTDTLTKEIYFEEDKEYTEHSINGEDLKIAIEKR